MNIVKNLSLLYTLSFLYESVQKGESCSYPFLVCSSNSVSFAIFSYVVTDEASVSALGYGRLISYDGEQVSVKELPMFENRKDLIISNNKLTTVAQHRVLYDTYCEALQNLADHYDSNREAFVKPVADLFSYLVSQDSLELYRRICPEFLALLGL